MEQDHVCGGTPSGREKKVKKKLTTPGGSLKATRDDWNASGVRNISGNIRTGACGWVATGPEGYICDGNHIVECDQWPHLNMIIGPTNWKFLRPHS